MVKDVLAPISWKSTEVVWNTHGNGNKLYYSRFFRIYVLHQTLILPQVKIWTAVSERERVRQRKKEESESLACLSFRGLWRRRGGTLGWWWWLGRLYWGTRLRWDFLGRGTIHFNRGTTTWCRTVITPEDKQNIEDKEIKHLHLHLDLKPFLMKIKFSSKLNHF